MSAVQISSDPFARETTIRVCQPLSERKECAWCGQPAKFKYGVESPMGRRSVKDRHFCSVGCFRTYNS